MKDFFYFTRSERRGLYLLSVILLILLGIKFYVKNFAYTPIIEVNKEKATSIIDSIEKLSKKSLHQKSTLEKTIIKKPRNLFIFDPNYLNIKGWKKLGLSEKQAQVIINYRNKGGKFYHKSDLKKIFVIDSNFYAKVEPFIKFKHTATNIEPKNPSKNKNKIKSKPLPPLLININICNSLELQKIKGIGPAYAQRIIRYRDLLGGFNNKNQLLEVYGIDQTLLNLMDSNFYIDSIEIKRLNINIETATKLSKHPYINWNLGKLIEKYRNQHGKYGVIEELLNLELLDSESFNKLKPYIKVGDEY